MASIITTRDFKGTGFTLRPIYNGGVPPAMPRTERAFDPARDHHTHNPRSHGILREKGLFSRPYAKPVMIDIQIKAAQSDVYYIPAEMTQFEEFLRVVIDREHNRSPSAFTKGCFLQVRQNMCSPAPKWHYDLGSPSRTYLAGDKKPTLYALNYPITLTPELRRKFCESAQSQEDLYEYQGYATDVGPLYQRHRNKVATLRLDPYEVAEHDHLTLHKGTISFDRTLATLGYVDTQAVRTGGYYKPEDFYSPLHPRAIYIESAPAEEASERLARHLKRYPAPVL